MSQFKILGVGSDCEIFLKDQITGKPVPVCGLLGGTKNEPRQVLRNLDAGFSVQEDNVMAEFNVPAVMRGEGFATNCDAIRAYLSGYFDSKGLDLNIVPSEVFEPEQLQSLQASRFGCQPDYNVWTLEENEIDKQNPSLKTMRTAGGHIHISFTVDGQKPELEHNFTVVKWLDLFLGVPSILMDPDKRRRDIYGKAGAFRVKKYTKNVFGVEYRTMSNFWFKDWETAYWVVSQVFSAIHNISSHANPDTFMDNYKNSIINTINNNDAGLARDLCSQFGINIPRQYRIDKKSQHFAAHAPEQIVLQDGTSHLMYTEIPLPSDWNPSSPTA